MQKVVLGTVLLLFLVTLVSLVDSIITTYRTKKAPALTALPSPAQTIHAPKKHESIEEKKRRFIHTILPSVQKVKAQLDTEYAQAAALASKKQRSAEEAQWLEEMMSRYNVGGIPCLLKRMHTHPVSLVIAQAALETGWGTSRFFQDAKNIFGIWSYHPDEPRIPASQQRGSKTVFVKKFTSYDDAVRGYFKMIAGGYAYSAFREARMKTQNPFELLRYLRHYSELRDEYVARLYYVIKANKLYQYDDPAYRPMALSKIIPEYVALKRKEKATQEQQLLALNEVKVAPETTKPPRPCEKKERTVTRQAPERSTQVPARSSLP